MDNVILDTEKSKLHREICNKLNSIYLKKNHDYDDAFAKSYAEYGMTMACIRLEDKLNRLKALSKTDSAPCVKEETIEDTLMDLANYAIMTLVERFPKKKENPSKLELIKESYKSILSSGCTCKTPTSYICCTDSANEPIGFGPNNGYQNLSYIK